MPVPAADAALIGEVRLDDDDAGADRGRLAAREREPGECADGDESDDNQQENPGVDMSEDAHAYGVPAVSKGSM
jgi:hypothetical protein